MKNKQQQTYRTLDNQPFLKAKAKYMSKTLLITGANRGIGLEKTRQAAMNGDQVIACARNVDRASDLVALTRENKGIEPISLDVTAENSMRQIAANIKCKIDVLVCNAGVLNGYGGLEDETHQSQQLRPSL